MLHSSGPYTISRHVRVILFVGLLAGLAILTACTRERPPLPGTTPFPTLPAISATIAVGATPTIDPQTTPVVVVTPGIVGKDAGLAPTPATDENAPTGATAGGASGDLQSYTVQPGDTLYAIARKFGVDPQLLIDINQIANPSALQVGQQLRLPDQAQPAPAANAENSTDGATQTGAGYIHIVKRGETLFGIAQKYGVPLDQLAQANNITNPSALRAGQKLTIPTGSQQTPNAGSAQRIHIVQPGETLTAIAARYGVSPQAVMQANGLQNPNRIRSGQKLIIP